MNERELRYVSIVSAVLSLVSIYLLSLTAPVYYVHPCDLDYSMKGNNVKLEGHVTSLRVNEGNVFFTLADDGCEVRAVMWESAAAASGHGVIEDEVLAVEGMVDSYGGELEIIVKRISS